MPKVALYAMSGEQVGERELSDAVFGASVNEGVIYDVLKAQVASQRRGTASSKTRAEVRGSTRKIYRQKGTGRARHGNIRAPTFVGGGKAHGPKPRSYACRPPKKMRVTALVSALSLKCGTGRLRVLTDLNLEEIKTKRMANVLAQLGIRTSSLIVDEKENGKLVLSVRNLGKHLFLPPEGVNLYDVLRHEYLVLSARAVATLEGRYGT